MMMKKEKLQGMQDRKKGKIDLNKGLGLKDEEIKRALQEDFVIDVNKKRSFNDTPKFVK